MAVRDSQGVKETEALDLEGSGFKVGLGGVELGGFRVLGCLRARGT